MPVASLRASSDYKNVANCPIMVSRILYLMKLISENKAKTFLQKRDLVHLELSQGLKGFLTTLELFVSIKQYSTGLIVSYSRKNPIARNYLIFKLPM